jgi:hypothetical protein
MRIVGARGSIRCRLAALLLVALVLVPLAAAAHRCSHADAPGCAVCVLAHRSAGLLAPPPDAPHAARFAVVVSVPPSGVPASCPRSGRTGRAPPLLPRSA